MKKSNIWEECEFLSDYLEYTKKTILLSLKHAIQAHQTQVVTFSDKTHPICIGFVKYDLRSLYLDSDEIIVCFDESLYGKTIKLANHIRLDKMGIYFQQELLKRLSKSTNIL